jgi:hypothetical protein
MPISRIQYLPSLRFHFLLLTPQHPPSFPSVPFSSAVILHIFWPFGKNAHSSLRTWRQPTRMHLESSLASRLFLGHPYPSLPFVVVGFVFVPPFLQVELPLRYRPGSNSINPLYHSKLEKLERQFSGRNGTEVREENNTSRVSRGGT